MRLLINTDPTVLYKYTIKFPEYDYYWSTGHNEQYEITQNNKQAPYLSKISKSIQLKSFKYYYFK